MNLEKVIKTAIKEAISSDVSIPIKTKPVKRKEPSKKPVTRTPKKVKKPSEKEERLQVLLGRNIDTKKLAYWNPYSTIPTKLTNQHVLIVGKSGSGKTQSAVSFIDQLANKNVPSIIFDFQGEYVDKKLKNAKGQTFLETSGAKVLDASEGLDFNPLEVSINPITGEKRSYIRTIYQISDSLNKIFDLGDIQTAILQNSINDAFVNRGFVAKDKRTWNNDPPTMSELWTIIQSYKKEGGNLIFRIRPLFENDIFVDSNKKEFWDLFETTQILQLSNLATQKLMLAVSQFVLSKIYLTMLSKGTTSDLRLFVIVDEAHKLAFNQIINSLIREGRKYGVGLMLISQSVEDFDPIILSMAGTKIVMQLGREDADEMVNSMGFSEKEETNKAMQLILHQRPFQALVSSNHFQPFAHVNMVPFFKMR